VGSVTSSNLNPRVIAGLSVERQTRILRANQNGNNTRKIFALHENTEEGTDRKQDLMANLTN
jgi:hypothetical protein